MIPYLLVADVQNTVLAALLTFTVPAVLLTVRLRGRASPRSRY
jgi:hypothetical protein